MREEAVAETDSSKSRSPLGWFLPESLKILGVNAGEK